MKPSPVPCPEGAAVLEASGRGGTGNVLFLFHGDRETEAAVLKIYRVRRSRVREALRGFAHRFLEGKRGASAPARRETEAQSLRLWQREGFDVVRPLDRPVPPGIRDPALWLEYLDAPTLREVLEDPQVRRAEKEARVQTLGGVTCRRHRRALEIEEPLLVQEHAGLYHLLVLGERLVTFDLENGYRPGFPVREAMAQELAGYLRSLRQSGGADAEALLRAWVRGYGDVNLLRSTAGYAVRSRSPFRRIKRWHDRRRGAESKTASMERLLEML